MQIVLGLFVAGMTGFRAFQLYSAKPIDAVAWTWTGAWAAASLASLILIF